MSRAFVRESDQEPQPLPERAVSAHPNLVTQAGLKQLEARIQALDVERQSASDAGDTVTLAGIERDLRYFRARRGTARVIEPAMPLRAVVFGARVTLRFADGTERAFRLVGEDEGDPANALLSWVSPLAQSLLKLQVGDTVRFQGKDIEILGVEP